MQSYEQTPLFTIHDFEIFIIVFLELLIPQYVMIYSGFVLLIRDYKVIYVHTHTKFWPLATIDQYYYHHVIVKEILTAAMIPCTEYTRPRQP